MSLRLAYIAAIAASVALRLVFAYPQASASDQSPGNPRAMQAEPVVGSDSDTALLITGRSVALPLNAQASTGTGAAERRLHESVGAAGFIRR